MMKRFAAKNNRNNNGDKKNANDDDSLYKNILINSINGLELLIIKIPIDD